MSQPLRHHESGGHDAVPAPEHHDARVRAVPAGVPRDPDEPTLAELAQRARERAEAEAAVAEVMDHEAVRDAQREAIEHRVRRPLHLKLVLLLALLAFNAQLWFRENTWLQFHQPDALALDYYESSYRVAVYLQRERIEEYRREKGEIPKTALQAGTPVRGVHYTPVAPTTYQLSAGEGTRQFVYNSVDSLSLAFGRSLLRLAVAQGGGR